MWNVGCEAPVIAFRPSFQGCGRPASLCIAMLCLHWGEPAFRLPPHMLLTAGNIPCLLHIIWNWGLAGGGNAISAFCRCLSGDPDKSAHHSPPCAEITLWKERTEFRWDSMRERAWEKYFLECRWGWLSHCATRGPRWVHFNYLGIVDQRCRIPRPREI